MLQPSASVPAVCAHASLKRAQESQPRTPLRGQSLTYPPGHRATNRVYSASCVAMSASSVKRNVVSAACERCTRVNWFIWLVPHSAACCTGTVISCRQIASPTGFAKAAGSSVTTIWLSFTPAAPRTAYSAKTGTSARYRQPGVKRSAPASWHQPPIHAPFAFAFLAATRPRRCHTPWQPRNSFPNAGSAFVGRPTV